MNDTQKTRRGPSILTSDVANRIFDRLEEGQSLRQICRDPSMPARSSIFQWLRENQEFADKYACVKQMQIFDLEDEFDCPGLSIVSGGGPLTYSRDASGRLSCRVMDGSIRPTVTAVGVGNGTATRRCRLVALGTMIKRSGMRKDGSWSLPPFIAVPAAANRKCPAAAP
jgi:hypothetical protein